MESWQWKDEFARRREERATNCQKGSLRFDTHFPGLHSREARSHPSKQKCTNKQDPDREGTDAKGKKDQFKSLLCRGRGAKKKKLCIKPSEPEKAVKLFIQFPRIKCSTERLLSSAADIMLIAVQMSTLTPLHVVIQPQRGGSEMALHLFIPN